MGEQKLQTIQRIDLVEAFKIENGVLLKGFEQKLAKQKDSFLKGLFVMVKKSDLLQLMLFGFQSRGDKPDAAYRERYLRIPHVYLKNNVSVVEKMLMDN
mmetsp:Transcript_37325/g.35916  ORF Transcript_37325/g.35916 Transcript_37325/m.35916 type:complete len:99 (-) Transcript_37325:73-369(-)